MKLGKINIISIIACIFFILNANAEDKILTAPIINLEKLKPSYENLERDIGEGTNTNISLKKKNTKNKIEDELNFVNLIGLDKITAKTRKIKIKIGETVKFGLLEIKALKCGETKNEKIKNDAVAYLQVRDISENQNEKVFIFNGWTFSSNPSIAPIDHAIYDLWLVGCGSV